MTPLDYYTQQNENYSTQLKSIKQKRNLITLSKLLVFIGLILVIYWFITNTTSLLLFPGVLSVCLFLILTYLDSKIVYRQHLLEEHIRINTIEINYLYGVLSSLPPGSQYLNSLHPYAYDLDIFGEDSLFQHLNRTVTANGTNKLANWLLFLSKDPELLLRRQQAVAELADKTEWCHSFRAVGKLHPTQEIDDRILQQWGNESPFFSKRLSTRIGLLIANGITIISWILAIIDLVPTSLALCISFAQLLILVLFLKKINIYHRHLNIFIHTISNYLPLVKMAAKQTFTSVQLQNIQNSLLYGNNSAIRALSSLKKIQESMDQRGNILVAFILNGLYLKDLHLILRLDQWKLQYSPFIRTWTEAISETDALISMANYRFNHPDYTTPQFCENIILEALEISHPLLKSKQKISNNFTIDALHQLFIVTGANMAGKSTFLRTVGINLVLAQSGNVVCSSSFTFQPVTLFTSMRTTDNLATNTSYFHAELLRLKQLIRLAEQEERLFIILDEMLKGTNSVDKLNGSLTFLQKLLSYRISGLVATHDLALGELATNYPGNFFNVCFEITHTGNDMTFDYKLRPGISSTMNASLLMQQMGLI